MVRGKSREETERIMSDAAALDKHGVFSIVLESIPLGLAKLVTASVGAITIGIGAGIHCDGQVLVINDMLGMDTSFKPKHVKKYACLAETIRKDANKFIEDVRNGRFPDDAHSFH
jgi:3-methyl-2-oxobutanoate hydroxymethyltransferase